MGEKRNDFKLYNVEFMPLLDPLEHKDVDKQTLVWDLIPFSPLHTVILGPVSNIFEVLKDICDRRYGASNVEYPITVYIN